MVQQRSVLSPFLLTVVVDVVTELVRDGVLNELLYNEDLVLMTKAIIALRNKFPKQKEAFESKGLKVNFGKIKVMVSSNITKDGLFKSKFDQCGFCTLRVKAN